MIKTEFQFLTSVWFWEPLEWLCELCASVSWERASSSRLPPWALWKEHHRSVPHSSQLQDPDVFVVCCLYANTCVSLKIFVLFCGCGREKILRSLFSRSWCILMFSVWLTAGKCFFQWQCCFISVSTLELAYSPSILLQCSSIVFAVLQPWAFREGGIQFAEEG